MESLQFFAELSQTELFEIKIALGAFFGLCLGLTGVGGGVLLIPMLQVICDMNPVLAVGTASLISSLVKVNASITHIKARNVSWKNVGYLFLGALPITILVTQMVVYFNQHPIHSEITNQLINLIIITVMVGSLITVLRKYYAQRHNANESAPTSYTNTSKKGKKAIMSGIFCGSVLGSTGVGGGVLLLPVLNSILELDIKKAIGSSVILALALSTVTAIGYAKGGQADIYTAALFAIGSLLGVPVAGKLIKTCSSNMVYIITIVIIAISLLLTLFN